MGEDIEIIKKDLGDYLDLIKEINPDFYNHILPIYKMLPKEQRYVYYMTLPYGEQLIRDSRFVVFDKSNATSDIKISNEFTNQELTLDQIKNDFGSDIDFPLSLVLENMVEVFMRRKLDNNSYHKIPLDIINKGEFFGVWGVFDQLEGQKKVDVRQNWEATSGRSCFLPFFKDYPQQSTKARATDKIFEWLFLNEIEDKDSLSADKAIQKFIQKNVLGSEAKILCFPKHFYLGQTNHDCDYLKNTLLLKMYQNQWYETRTERGMFWKNVQLKSELEEEFNLTALDIQIINHIINIISGKDFYLKPISKEDPIEFEAYKLMVEKVKELNFVNGNCTKLKIKNDTVVTDSLKYKGHKNSEFIKHPFQVYTPYFMCYEKKKNSSSDVFISFLKSPLIMSLFYYDNSRNKLKQEWNRSKITSIEKVIRKYTGISITLKILKTITESEEFVNTYIGKKSKDFLSEKPFDYIELMSKNENVREFFSDRKSNLPSLFKQYPICIKINN